MLKTFLQRFEDPNRQLLGPSIWILKNMGLILPENRAEKIAYIILHEIVTFFVLTQYMELYVIRSDLDLVLTNLKISMLSIVCIVKANTFVFWQASWKEVIQYVTEADKYERDTRDSVKGKILDTYTKYCRRVLYFYWVLVFTTFLTVTTTPLVRYLSSPNYREALRSGLELFPHIFSSWMPFDKYHSPGSWITVLWHISLCAYGAGIMAAYDTSIVVIMVFFGGKLEILRERCKQMLGSNGLGISDQEAGKIIRQLHNTHVLIMKYNRIPRRASRVVTEGGQEPRNKLAEQLRQECAHAGYTEALTFTLCSQEDVSAKLGAKDSDVPAAQIANPKTLELQVVRPLLLPGLLKTLAANKRMPLPLKLFEVSDVVLLDSNAETGARNERRVCAVYCGRAAGFQFVHGLLDRLMALLRAPWGPRGYSLRPCQDPAYFPGRCALKIFKIALKAT